MSAHNDGGAAFPFALHIDGPMVSPLTGNEVAAGNTEHTLSTGMSLRAYIAAKAIAALIAHPNKDCKNCGKQAVKKLAGYAVEYADALIEALEAGQ